MNKEFKLIDLTHTLHSDIPGWDGDCGFRMSLTLDYKDCTPPYLFQKHDLQTPCGVGTHMDAPAHLIPNGRTVDKMTLEELVSDCVVIDVSNEIDENYVIMPDIINKFEEKFGEIKPNTFVIFYTGWDKHWEVSEKYINNHIFPSVDRNTAELLLERKISGLGIDTLSADTGANGFPVHNAILGADKYLVENIANAKELPPIGAKSFVLPVKIKDGAEAPIRLIAII